MMQTVVEFIVPFTFVDQGEYNVSLGGKVAQIVISMKQNKQNLKNFGIEVNATGSGSVQFIPDPHGVANISEVQITLPYACEKPNDLLQRLPPDAVGRENIPSMEIDDVAVKNHCIGYLNRLISVVRWRTHKFWISSISERDILSITCQTIDEKGQTKEIIEYGGRLSGVSTEILEQSDVKQDIDKILAEERYIPFYDILLLDALDYFEKLRFNESVIMANVALENLAIRYLYDKLRKKMTEEDAKKAIEPVKESKHFMKIMTTHFKTIDNRSLADNVDLLTKLEYVRKVRKIAVHPIARDIQPAEASTTINNIFEIIQWIVQPSVQPTKNEQPKNKQNPDSFNNSLIK